MKKLLIGILILSMLLPAAALADLPDISGLSYDELVQLKEQINLAIWNSQEWQEVTVPAGAWEIGKDIPEGYWTITLPPDMLFNVYYCDKINAARTGLGYGYDYLNSFVGTMSSKKKKNGAWSFPDDPDHVDIYMTSGWYLFNEGPVIITPYSGKPDLGFK